LTFRLSRQAEEDVIRIYLYTTKTFGITQADAYHDKLETTFNLLGAQPYMAREPPKSIRQCVSIPVAPISSYTRFQVTRASLWYAFGTEAKTGFPITRTSQTKLFLLPGSGPSVRSKMGPVQAIVA